MAKVTITSKGAISVDAKELFESPKVKKAIENWAEIERKSKTDLQHKQQNQKEVIYMNNLTVSKLLSLLSTDNQLMEVKFTKKTTGEERVMLCTRYLEYVPSDKMPKSNSLESEKDTITESELLSPISAFNRKINVFDMNKKDWRSFIPSNVSSITIESADRNGNLLRDSA